MKKAIYLIMCVFLGILASFLVHGALEMAVIWVLINYGPWLSWNAWYSVHHVFTAVLFVAGIYFGLLIGKKWWHMVYVEKRHWRKNN